VRAILAATSEGLYIVGVRVCDDYPEVSAGVQELFRGPVSALAVHARNSTLQAFALTDAWEELQFNHFHLGSMRATSPVPTFAPTCMIDIGTSSWSRAAGTVGAHLFGVFERTDAEGEQWDAEHGGEDGVRYDPVPAFDSIPDRDTWTQPWGAPADLRSLAVLRGESVAVLANAHVGGVVRSNDDGATWTQLVDPRIDVHQVATLPPAGALVAHAARWRGGLRRYVEWVATLTLPPLIGSVAASLVAPGYEEERWLVWCLSITTLAYLGAFALRMAVRVRRPSTREEEVGV
jgi:hypothetical protein